jgi:hypothetical protein
MTVIGIGDRSKLLADMVGGQERLIAVADWRHEGVETIEPQARLSDAGKRQQLLLNVCSGLR